MTTPDPARSPREGLHSIWREAAEKRIDAGVDWPRIVLDLLNECDNLAARLSAQETAIRADEARRVVPLVRRAVLDPGAFVKRGADYDGNPYGERLDQWQNRAIDAALLDPSGQGSTT